MGRDAAEFGSDRHEESATDIPPTLLPLVNQVADRLVPFDEKPRGKPVAVIGEAQEGTRHLAGVMLEEVGYRVLDAADTEETAALIDEHAGEVKLVLLEVGTREHPDRPRSPESEGSLVVVSAPSLTKGASRCHVRRINNPWLPLELLREAERALSR
jgi:hypothetical protein